MNTPNAHIAALTGLRGLAAAWVASYHGWQAAGAPALPLLGVDFSPLLGAGYFGVDLFFVLSGFLLGPPLLQALQTRGVEAALGHFWRRRCLRVLPAYWAQLAILFALALAAGRTIENPALTLLSHATLSFNLVPFDVVPLNRVYWSLPVEWNFYIVLPLLVFALMRLGWAWLLPLALGGAIAYRLLCWSTVADVPPSSLLSWWVGSIHQLPARIDQFLLGMFAAWLLQHRAPGARTASALALASVAGLALMAVLVGPRGDVFSRGDVPLVFLQFSLLGALFAALCLAAARGSRLTEWLFGGRAIGFLGTISYSLYLWHAPILGWQAGWAWHGAVPGWLHALLVALLILAVSTLSYRWLERPFLQPHAARGPKPGPADAEREAPGMPPPLPAARDSA